MADMKLLEQFRAARRVSTPIVLITTADQWRMIDTLAADINGGGAVIVQDCIHGLREYAGNELGLKAKQAIGLDQDKTINPVAVLTMAETKMPGNTVLFMVNAHRHFVDMPTRMLQAVSNVRDAFKLNKRMLVLLAPALPIPAELEGDIVALDEARPTPDDLRKIVARQHENASLAMPDAPIMAHVVDALAGLKAFEAEQVTALSLRKDGIAREQVWERKRQAIQNTEGLHVWTGRESFDTLGGLANIKSFLRAYINGPNRPAGIVWIDEIEKDTAGMQGDNTGVAQRQHKALLSHMQDKEARGIILAGQPGAGKSAIAKALGVEAGVPVIQLNLGDLLGAHVGDSERMMRNALKTIDAVCQGRALFVATCNDLKGLSPELRGRFKNGSFFFDLPDADERETIWRLYLKKFDRKPNEQRPHDVGWVGREIEACCDQAHSLGVSLVEAAQYIVPQAVAMREAVERRRTEADGSLVSASYPGPFQRARVQDTAAAAAPKRKGERAIALED
jgi:hypothetical protein